MIYLASPYSSPDPLIVRTRFLLTEQCCAALIKRDEFVWSPIVHCHELATRYSLPTDAEFWKRYNFDFIRRADAVYVLKIPGWDESKGVRMELDFSAQCGLRVEFVDADGAFL